MKESGQWNEGREKSSWESQEKVFLWNSSSFFFYHWRKKDLMNLRAEIEDCQSVQYGHGGRTWEEVQRSKGAWGKRNERMAWDFLGGPVVKNLPCNVGDAGLIPSQGIKILRALHVVEQLSSHAITTEPTARESAPQERSHMTQQSCMPQPRFNTTK